MTETTSATITAPRIAVGDRLPTITHTLSTRDIALGAAGSRDWLEQHYDRQVSIDRLGLDDILVSTPMIASWFDRLVTDFTGVYGRLGRYGIDLRKSIIAGETITVSGEVTAVRTDDTGCRWADVEAYLSVGDERRAEASITVAVPAADGDNPWDRSGDRWRP